MKENAEYISLWDYFFTKDVVAAKKTETKKTKKTKKRKTLWAGAVKPLSNLWREFATTFKPYRHFSDFNHDLFHDLASPVRGIKNIFTGLACLFFPTVLIKNEDEDRILPWKLEGILRVVVGAAQVVLSPINLIVKTAIRAFITAIVGKAKIEDGDWVKDLANKMKNAKSSDEKEKIRTKFYKKFKEALDNQQKSNYLINPEVFERLVKTFELDRQKFARIGQGENCSDKILDIKYHALKTKTERLSNKREKLGLFLNESSFGPLSIARWMFGLYVGNSWLRVLMSALLFMSAFIVLPFAAVSLASPVGAFFGAALSIGLLVGYSIFFAPAVIAGISFMGGLAKWLIWGSLEKGAGEKHKKSSDKLCELKNIKDLSSGLHKETSLKLSADSFSKINTALIKDVITDNANISQLKIVATKEEENNIKNNPQNKEKIAEIEQHVNKKTNYGNMLEVYACLDSKEFQSSEAGNAWEAFNNVFFSPANSNLADRKLANQKNEPLPNPRINLLDLLSPTPPVVFESRL